MHVFNKSSLYLFLSSSFSLLSSKLLGTKDKIRRISVPFFCTVLYHVRSTGNCFSLSLRRHVHKFSKYSRMLNLATTGSTLRARRHKYTATWTIMVRTRCIYLVSVFVAGFSYWSIQLHPLNLLATWFRQQWMMKTPKFNLFWGRGDE